MDTSCIIIYNTYNDSYHLVSSGSFAYPLTCVLTPTSAPSINTCTNFSIFVYYLPARCHPQTALQPKFLIEKAGQTADMCFDTHFSAIYEQLYQLFIFIYFLPARCHPERQYSQISKSNEWRRYFNKAGQTATSK